MGKSGVLIDPSIYTDAGRKKPHPGIKMPYQCGGIGTKNCRGKSAFRTAIGKTGQASKEHRNRENPPQGKADAAIKRDSRKGQGPVQRDFRQRRGKNGTRAKSAFFKNTPASVSPISRTGLVARCPRRKKKEKRANDTASVAVQKEGKGRGSEGRGFAERGGKQGNAGLLWSERIFSVMKTVELFFCL